MGEIKDSDDMRLAKVAEMKKKNAEERRRRKREKRKNGIKIMSKSVNEVLNNVHSSPYTLQMQRAADAEAGLDTQITQSEMHLEFNDAISKKLPRIRAAKGKGADQGAGGPRAWPRLVPGMNVVGSNIPSSDEEDN